MTDLLNQLPGQDSHRASQRNSPATARHPPSTATGLEHTAVTAVHEGPHLLGVRGSRRAEALVRLEELRCLGVRIDRAAMRQVLQDMRNCAVIDLYKERYFRGRSECAAFPGVKF